MHSAVSSARDEALIAAMEENVIDLFRHIHRWSGITTCHSDWYLQGVSQHPNPFFNSVIRTRMTAAQVDEGIAAAVSRCREQKVSLMWLRLPNDEPKDLAAALERHGVRQQFTDPGMVVDRATYQAAADRPPALSMQQVADHDLLERWLRVLVAGFEFPAEASQPLLQVYRTLAVQEGQPTEQYLACWQRERVATATIHFTGRTAGIYNVTTLPKDRRQGISLALCDHLLQRAWQRGCDLVCLQSSQPGFNIYRKLGFKTICQVHFHFWHYTAARE
jgi:ribosomal protein S18 acetylase RimI-like enzyme